MGIKKFALDLSLEEWRSWCQALKLPSFLAEQIVHWIFAKELLDPYQFSNIGMAQRNQLADSFFWELPIIDSCLLSSDGSEKILLKMHDHLLIEMVIMPYSNRTTLCLSSQVGCRIGCTFCQTGKMGFKRNLSSGEILAQLLLANQRLKGSGLERVTNVVFMGMGEPLDNYEEVVKACALMIEPKAAALSPHRVTISTSGLVPEIERLGKELPVRLAISLHNADNDKRSRLMPINRKYSLAMLKEALLEYPASKRYGITFEYVMIEGVNDSLQDAKKLVTFLHGLKAKVNLIPMNHFPGVEMHSSSSERLREFQSYLALRSIAAPVRYSRNQDRSGGCGQLATKRAEETHLDPREVARRRRLSTFQKE